MTAQHGCPAVTLPSPAAVLLDIEGTICPITFVHDVLFPYALSALPEVARSRWQYEEFRSYIEAFPAEAQTCPEALVEHVKDLTARDIKIAYLKNLQGYLWKTGYETGAFTTPLFPDVVPFLKASRAREPHIKLGIYSSGSIAAQKLFASYVMNETTNQTEDLRPLFSSHFDTVNAGNKLDASSYTKITKDLRLSPDLVHFYTDNVKEAQAAEEAGVTAFLVVRSGNAPLTEEQTHRWLSKSRLISSFEQIDYV